MRGTITAVLAAGFTILLAIPGVLFAAPAAAKGPIEVVTFPLEPFTETNPCTGEQHEVSGTLTLRIHEFELENPKRHHFNIQFVFDLVTDDGFSGRGVGPDVDNGFGLFEEEEGTGMFQSIFNGNFSNEDGQRIKVHANFHINQIDGEPVAIVDNFFGRCVGKPA